ncbi:MAG: hypothetical protein CFE21_11370 [Bacteroidetes bacterium B1(2017)]|nr:MAG: hypothetical protein CFE21_11370 [Bacteroidetes bacterium B1(2017)]
MKKLVLLIGLVSLLAACSPPNVVKVWSDEKHVIDASKTHKYIYFVQSNNQINSRIAQDRLVRLSSNPSIQGYLYTKGDRINAGNREFYQSKMKQDGYDYVVVMRLTDTLSAQTNVAGEGTASNRSFYSDYSVTIDPYAYNPGYQREDKIFVIETNLYYVETGTIVWSSISKVYNPTSVEKATDETSKEVIKKMKRQGFLIK